VDSAVRAGVLRVVEAAIFAPVMKPLEDALGPVGSTAFGSILQRCFDASDR
jgi:hypothetical protein